MAPYKRPLKRWQVWTMLILITLHIALPVVAYVTYEVIRMRQGW